MTEPARGRRTTGAITLIVLAGLTATAMRCHRSDGARGARVRGDGAPGDGVVGGPEADRATSTDAGLRATSTDAGLGATATDAGLHQHCGDFVAFAFRCGIGRPPPDPTLDIGTQRNNEIVIRQGVTERCRAGEQPYDAGLIRCFLDAGDDCAAYDRCADQVVSDRRAREQGAPPR